MHDLIRHIASALVAHPDAIEIKEEKLDDENTTIVLQVAQDDLGKVIGKQGRTARAIRSLLSAANHGKSLQYRLEIAE
ncbi:MAG: KH domain-containing protein [Spirochaetales bacterium]|jgi:predicted RNA-binding protein YlqC (UPF0109 family)|nr:KH domain-containing protein [Spirochaetales bacterium]